MSSSYRRDLRRVVRSVSARVRRRDVPAAHEDPPDDPRFTAFLRVAVEQGDVDRALVALVRGLLDGRDVRHARGMAQVLQRHPSLGPVGDICDAVVSVRDPMPSTAWQLFTRNDVRLVMRLAPVVFLRLAFAVDPVVARETLRRALDGEFVLPIGPSGWVDLARLAFVDGATDLAGRALDRAQRAPAARRPGRLQSSITDLRSWLRREPAEPPADGEVAVGVLGHGAPDRVDATPDDLLHTAAGLAHLVRRQDVRLRGAAALTDLATALRTRVPADRTIAGSAAVRLYQVDRDASSWSGTADGTWLIVAGPLMRQLAGVTTDLPLDERVRPIFLGVEIEPATLVRTDALDYLRRHAPIGARDWNTVFLLLAAGVPAFFSGWLTSTLDLLAAPTGSSSDEPIAAALDALAAGPAAEQSPGRYVARRALGHEVRFAPPDPTDSRLVDVADLPAAQFAEQQRGIADKLDAVLSAVLDGSPAEQVYARWREVCASDVAAAEKRFTIGPIAEPIVDVVTACAAIRDAATTVERTAPAGAGGEVNLEFSLDGNFKHQLEVVLTSMLEHTARPLRVYALCRDHTQADFERFATLFPEVSAVWLPMDRVDYGPVPGMVRHVTVATMDRLLLPSLLPEVDRIVHHDLDALCMGDIAELFDVDLDGHPVAARDQEHPHLGSGYVSLFTQTRNRRSRELSTELLLRLCTRHPFDFRTFNAGVMVLDLARMRADEFCRNYLPYVERFGANGQVVLNAYAGSDRCALDPRWNTYPKFELRDDAKILHWIGPMKAWDASYVRGREQWRAAERALASRERARGLR